MKVDIDLSSVPPEQAAPLGKKAEEMGFDGVWIGETNHDPFLELGLIAAVTERIQLGTAVALAFTKSPMELAYTSRDLQAISNGRFTLGLGSQVKGHIERRFSMQWTAPAPRMRDTILSLRSIWHTWQEGLPLNYKGRFYSFTLMTPFFNPGPLRQPIIPIHLAAVNPVMAQLGGELCEGVQIHPLHTKRYLERVLIPSVERGAKKAGKTRKDVDLAAPIFAAVGENSQEIHEARELMRHNIAFYASTRSYEKILTLHGWEEATDRLHEMSVKGDWSRMPSAISDQMLNEFIVEGTWSSIADSIRKKYGGLLDRVRLYMVFDGTEKWKKLKDLRRSD